MGSLEHAYSFGPGYAANGERYAEYQALVSRNVKKARISHCIAEVLNTALVHRDVSESRCVSAMLSRRNFVEAEMKIKN